MKKRSLVGILVAFLVLYVVFFGTPLIRIESKERVIEMKASDEDYSREVEIFLPAVEENEEGIMALLKVKLVEGEGKTLLEIDDISFLKNTQESIRVSKRVSEKVTNIETSNYDIIYSIDANASVIEGPSAGPAMAVATSFALLNESLNHSVIISGYLQEDGTVSKVSGILAKAEVAKKNSIKLFLVPLGQRAQVKTETRKVCETIGLTSYCETETTSKRVDIQEEIGIEVIEVGSISEALEYFIMN
ncbi:MAG: hypothetical protein GF368_01330 [Candidatus Aenigmarchaeota archaeon]|nr:hypothetical protein [Candidatus Aenigmarchaeota archaeon]